jgi:hypothetical protein
MLNISVFEILTRHEPYIRAPGSACLSLGVSAKLLILEQAGNHPATTIIRAAVREAFQDIGLDLESRT